MGGGTRLGDVLHGTTVVFLTRFGRFYKRMWFGGNTPVMRAIVRLFGDLVLLTFLSYSWFGFFDRIRFQVFA